MAAVAEADQTPVEIPPEYGSVWTVQSTLLPYSRHFSLSDAESLTLLY